MWVLGADQSPIRRLLFLQKSQLHTHMAHMGPTKRKLDFHYLLAAKYASKQQVSIWEFPSNPTLHLKEFQNTRSFSPFFSYDQKFLFDI